MLQPVTRRVGVVLATTLASCVALAPASADAAVGVNRIGGATRYDTAASVFTQRSVSFGTPTAAVLTRGDQFADALAAGPLAAALKAPLLTTPSTSLSPAALRTITEAKITTVYIVGGTGSVSAGVAATLQKAGVTVVRIAGVDRFDTAREVGARVAALRRNAPTPVFVASGLDFPDALAAGAAAGATGGVVILSAGRKLDDETVAYLDSGLTGRVYGVGGAASAALWDSGFGHIPVVGANRYETAVDLAARIFPNPTTAVVASGTTYADALPGGVLAALNKGPVLLTPPNSLDPATGTYLAYTRPTIDLMGGTNAVSTAVENALGKARSGAVPTVVGGQPRLVSDVQDVYGLMEGNDLRLTVYAVGDGLSYSWFKIGPDGERIAIPGANGPTYVKSDVRPEDAGRYLVAVRSTNGTGIASEPTVVEVMATPPTATITGASTAKVGQTYTATARGGMPRSYPAVVEKGATTLAGVVTKGDYLTRQVAFEPFPEEAGQVFEIVMVTEDGQIEPNSPRVPVTIVR